MKYREKPPVVVEAVQFTGQNFAEVLAFTGGRLTRVDDRISINVPTMNAELVAIPGDYVVKPVAGGGLYIQGDSYFEHIYEPAE